jgi:hypothetical protein
MPHDLYLVMSKFMVFGVLDGAVRQLDVGLAVAVTGWSDEKVSLILDSQRFHVDRVIFQAHTRPTFGRTRRLS